MMTMGIFLPMFIGFAALSVDISYINMSKTQSQNVADAASHAAFVSYRATQNLSAADAAAEFIVSQNTVGGGQASLERVEYGEWDFDSLQFTVNSAYINSARAVVSRNTASGNELKLFFAPLLGQTTANVRGQAVSAGRTRQIMLVTDVSCSFRSDIDSARDANIAFLDYMAAHPYPGDLLGQAVFAGRKTFPLLHELASPIQDYNSLLSEFQKLNICSRMRGDLKGSPTYSGSCYTSQARGMHWAFQEFITNGDPREFQAIVLLTDGQANTHLTSSRDGRYRSTAESDTEMIRDFMWDGGSYAYDVWECPYGERYTSNCGIRSYSGSFNGGVHLWTVYFGGSGSNVSWLQSLTDFDGNRGSSKDTEDPSELEVIMVEIASSIPIVITD